jgi:major intracellular serine protease
MHETICILDTGVNFSHPDLLGQNVTCPLDCTSSSCITNCSLKDYHGHGTHVAGIAASAINRPGVARGANLISLKVCDETDCWDDDIEAAIIWSITNKDAYNISVISMSLGDCSAHETYCNTDYLATSVNQATNNNITVVASAGNCDQANCPELSCTEGISSPACIENVVPVGGVDNSDNMDYYQRGDILQLLAPGVGISAPDNDGSGYATYSGTSMAAPHVSGLIAIIKQYKKLESNKILQLSEIKNSLFESGLKINDSGNTNKNYSRVDAYATILYLDEQAPNITYMSPPNNSLKEPQNQSFICNATDLLQFIKNTIGHAQQKITIQILKQKLFS